MSEMERLRKEITRAGVFTLLGESEPISPDIFKPADPEEIEGRKSYVQLRREAEKTRWASLTPEQQAAERPARTRLPQEDRRAIASRVRALGVTYMRVYSERDRMNFFFSKNVTVEIIDTLAAEFPEYNVTFTPVGSKLILKKK